MSLSTTGQISFSQINSALRITNGNLGIGTSAPSYKVDVNGTIKGTTYTGENMLLSGNITSGGFLANGNVSASTYTGGNMRLSGNITTNSVYSRNGVNVLYGNCINVSNVTNSKMMDVIYTTNPNVDKTRIFAPGNQTGGDTSKLTIQSNGAIGIGTEAPREALEVRGHLRVGNNTSANYIAFGGVSGDGFGTWDHTYIGERLFGGNDLSELLLFKGNDPAVTSGPDRIRLLAPEICFDTHTGLSGSFDGVGSQGTRQMTITTRGTIVMSSGRVTARLNVGGGIDLDGSSQSAIRGYGTGPLRIIPNFTTNDYIQMYDEVRLGDSGSNTIFKGTSATMGSTVVQNQLTISGNTNVLLRFDRSFAGTYDFEIGMEGNGELFFRSGADGTGAAVLTEYMRIRDQGIVSAGNLSITGAITAGTVMLNSGTNRTLTYAFVSNVATIGTTTNGNFSYSIYATQKIACAEFNIYSDERIKTNIIDVNDSSALETIRQIQPKRYNYVDTVTKGETPVWGFIAQQVGSVLDYSVNKVNEYVPNVYSKASVTHNTEGSVLTLVNGTTSVLDILKAPENKIQIKIYIDDENEFVKEVYVKEIINTNQIKLEICLDASISEVFVYGQKVNDFHALNKDAIFTVSVGALQEIDRRLQIVKDRVSNRVTTINTLNQEMQDISNRMLNANL